MSLNFCKFRGTVVGPYTCFILTESEIYDTQKEVLASIKK